MSLDQAHLLARTNPSICNRSLAQQHADDVLTLYNVPETNLSTAEEHMDYAETETPQDEDDGSALGLNWEFGVAQLPGSDFQLRMDENGDVEVVGADEKKDSLEKNEEEEDDDDDSFTTDLNVPRMDAEENDPSLSDTSGTSPKLECEKVDFSKVKIEHPDPPAESDPVLIKQEPEAACTPDTAAIDCNFSDGGEVKCEFCGVPGLRSKFMGRFCSKVCIGKNANKRKYIRFLTDNTPVMKSRRSDDEAYGEESPSVVTETGGLKIKIRLPSTPNANRRVSLDVRHVKTSKRRHTLESTYAQHVDLNQTFFWDDYLFDSKSKAVPPEVFEAILGKSPFPLERNRFKVGWFLEAVDPMHQSLICLTSVVQVQGHRMRLHFEGYSDCYDFWVNADSPFLFPCGFCECSGRQLNPPKGYSANEFDWRAYTSVKPNSLAPEKIFAERKFTNETGFKIGDKLEAVDRKYHDLTCTATISDAIGHYVLVHFDGWEKDYDYWASRWSPFIRPVGWCKENNKDLSPPLSHDLSKAFSWSDYVKSSDALAADPACFLHAGHSFAVGAKLEVVDQRNPILVRVATVVEVTDLRIKVHFDGWDDCFDDWFDVDSLDLHPMHWCSTTSHHLQPPPHLTVEPEGRKSCPIYGCSGMGHANGPRVLTYHRKHHSEYGCPYSPRNFKRQRLSDRFSGNSGAGENYDIWASGMEAEAVSRPGKVGRPRRLSKLSDNSSAKDDKKRRPQRMSTSIVSYHKYSEHRDKKERKSKCRHHSHKHTIRRKRHTANESEVKSSLISSLSALSYVHLPQCWDHNVKLLPGVAGIKSSQVTKWTPDEVAGFVEKVTGRPEYADVFVREEIDGEALLLLTQSDISKVLDVKLGPAVKLYNAVLLFKVMEKEPESNAVDPV